MPASCRGPAYVRLSIPTISAIIPTFARPPPPSMESAGEGGRWLGVVGPGLKSQVPWHAGSTPHTPWQHTAPLSLLVAVLIPPLPLTPSRSTRPDPRRAASALGREKAMT